MTEKTAIMVDSACDLPPQYIAKNDIHIIPINMQYKHTLFKDQRDPTKTAEFYKDYAQNKKATISSEPSSSSQIRNQIIKDIAAHYDNLLILSISSTRSEIYDNAREAATMIPKILRGLYDDTAYQLSKLSVVDTKTLFSGQAVITYAVCEALKKYPDVTLAALAKYAANLSKNIYSYTVLDDLFYIKHRGKLRGKKA